MAKQVTVTDSSGKERQMYLQGQGSVVSVVSPNENSSWKTEETVFNSSIKEVTEEKGDPRDNVTVIVTSAYEGSDGDYDYEDSDFNSSNSSDDWGSNCGGADIPDYIDPDTASFDEEGNFSGGTMRDLNED